MKFTPVAVTVLRTDDDVRQTRTGGPSLTLRHAGTGTTANELETRTEL